MGQRFRRWPFLWFIPCSNVQNFPKFSCYPAFVCGDRMGVVHRGLRVGVPEPILRTAMGAPIWSSNVALPCRTPLADQAVNPRRTLLGCKQQAQRVRMPTAQLTGCGKTQDSCQGMPLGIP